LCSPHSLQHVLDRVFGLRELVCIAGAQHHIRVGPMLRIEKRIAADRDLRIGFGNLTELHINVALAHVCAHGFREHATPKYASRYRNRQRGGRSSAGSATGLLERCYVTARGVGAVRNGCVLESLTCDGVGPPPAPLLFDGDVATNGYRKLLFHRRGLLIDKVSAPTRRC